MRDLTTITVERKVAEELRLLKIHPNQSVNEVIAQLIDQHKARHNLNKLEPRGLEVIPPYFSRSNVRMESRHFIDI